MDSRAPLALITGGSRGIGAATAQLLAANGYQVAIVYRQQSEAAAEVVASIEANSGRALALRCDVSEEDQVEDLFQTLTSRHGVPTALVNNAGILETQQRVDQLSAARLERIFKTNVIGTFLCAREAIKRMSTRHGGPGGAIVNVSSVASRLGAAGEYVDYAASKGAIDSFTIGLSQEVAREGIRVNAVRPGFIHTDIHASGGEPNRVERVSSAIPLGRGGTTQEVAQAIAWLLSEEASYCTGTFIDLAGGR